MATVPYRQRRTQEQRSAETRSRLLQATVECLLELGYVGTSTPEVCRRAGLSRGALLHHFGGKADLVEKALGHLVQTESQHWVDPVQWEACCAGDDEYSPLEQVFELMWKAFTGPLFHITLELWVAARNDLELHKALFLGSARPHNELGPLLEGLPADRPELSAEADALFDDLLHMTLHLLRGMALQRMLRPDAQEHGRHFARWRTMAMREMASIREKRTTHDCSAP